MFLLRRIAQNPANIAVEVDFSVKQTSPNSAPSLHSLPLFNKDQLYYTPSFMLEADQVHFENYTVKA